jgi:hypothetical protein
MMCNLNYKRNLVNNLHASKTIRGLQQMPQMAIEGISGSIKTAIQSLSSKRQEKQ